MAVTTPEDPPPPPIPAPSSVVSAPSGSNSAEVPWCVHDQPPDLCQIIPHLNATSTQEGKGPEQPEGTLPNIPVTPAQAGPG